VPQAAGGGGKKSETRAIFRLPRPGENPKFPGLDGRAAVVLRTGCPKTRSYDILGP